MPRLENWSIMIRTSSPYEAPELGKQCLVGIVFYHPRFPDGERIYTSTIVGVEGDLIVTKSGSRYDLGTVDPEYEKEFPNAMSQVLKRLRRLQNDA